jgi:hypothetical protein
MDKHTELTFKLWQTYQQALTRMTPIERMKLLMMQRRQAA